MSIKIIISNKVTFPVKGVTNDADGAEQEFDFTLTAHRKGDKDLQEIQKALLEESGKPGAEALVINKLSELITNWSGVRDESDASMAYDAAAFERLCTSYKNLSVMIWHAYNLHVGARAKN